MTPRLAQLIYEAPVPLRRRVEGQLRKLYPALRASWKTEALDFAFSTFGVRRFADLGGVWKVHGGYSFYALRRYPIERAYLCDLEFDAPTLRRAKEHQQLELVEGRFADPETVDRARPVDAVLLFDVLLHQSAPDWAEVLRRWSEAARVMVVANPQWQAHKTTRLLDMGRDAYLASLPEGVFEGDLQAWLEGPEDDDGYGKAIRDSHALWQWGITDEDLILHMEELGYHLVFQNDFGEWGNSTMWVNRGFVFAKRPDG